MKILINLFIILFLNVSFINSMDNIKGKGIVEESSGTAYVEEKIKREVYPSVEVQNEIIVFWENYMLILV
ncbi:hypothetical protein Mgra_00009586 [Meloidogyne graminicola]|uniref:Uncharacterized protein n=1 Tax=Meloidogyne graminicola TaxID=189291 RepID=A0A8S9Z902_9BILA|nr:hypothetical protein Mgra_00009586 [Meloidogyne graminicola]